MKSPLAAYNTGHFFTAIFMILALLWLTVSTPFVASYQQKTAQEKNSRNNPLTGTEEENANPFASTTEEKAPSGPNTLNEYLHQQEELQHPSGLIPTHNAAHSPSEYTAFHGELVGPPPKI